MTMRVVQAFHTNLRTIFTSSFQPSQPTCSLVENTFLSTPTIREGIVRYVYIIHTTDTNSVYLCANPYAYYVGACFKLPFCIPRVSIMAVRYIATRNSAVASTPSSLSPSRSSPSPSSPSPSLTDNALLAT